MIPVELGVWQHIAQHYNAARLHILLAYPHHPKAYPIISQITWWMLGSMQWHQLLSLASSIVVVATLNWIFGLTCLV